MASGTFFLNEKYDMNVAAKLNLNELDDDFKGRLQATLKKVRGGRMKVGYSRVKKDYGRFFGRPVGVGKEVGVCLQSMPRNIRNALASNIYHDIDIVNCHPTLFAHKAKLLHVATPSLNFYNENRDTVLHLIMDKSGCTREQAKNLFIRVLYGGKVSTWCQENGIDMQTLPKYILALENEVKMVEFEFVTKNPEFAKVVKTIKGGDGFKFSSALSYFLCNLEYDCISALTDFLQSQDWVVGANMFDGLLVEKRADIDCPPLTEASEYVKLKTGISVSFVSKPIAEGSSELVSDPLSPSCLRLEPRPRWNGHAALAPL